MNCDSDSLDDRTLRRLQRDSFNYFVSEVNPANGLVLDKTADDWPASIAAVGMALTVYPVGVERKFMTRAEAVELTLAALRFFAASEQGEGPGATGHKGFYYHFLHMETGKRAWECELSSIDTALLMAGVLAAGLYYGGADKNETEIRSLSKMLFERVDWDWMRNGGQTLCHGWRPEAGFIPYHWEGYDEALILYLMAMGSPTHPIPPECYEAWCGTYEWKEIYGIELLYAGPLFITRCRISGATFAASATASCASTTATISRTAGAPRWSTSNMRSAIRWGSSTWASGSGASRPATGRTT